VAVSGNTNTMESQIGTKEGIQMKEIIDQLRVLDPELVKELEEVTLDGWSRPRKQLLDYFNGCIIRSIRNRRWIFEIVSPDREYPNYTVYIFKSLEEFRKSLATAIVFIGIDESLHIALANAYISALKNK
jgi:hypothetical protein